MNITLTQAESVIAAARALADERGVAAAFAVVDTGGNLVAFARTDGANLITIDTAIGKAFTAVSIGGDSVNLTPAIQPGGPLFGTGLVLAGSRSLVPYGGGVLIRAAGRGAGDADGDATAPDADRPVIGALGVSGAPSSDVDHDLATAASTAASAQVTASLSH